MSNKLAQKPRITPHHSEGVNISAFGEKQTSFKHLGISTVNVETLTGEPITLSVLLVSMIAAPLWNTYHTYWA